jgi:hypothetical protein
MTYLQLVNKVLIRLRENEVTSVQDSPYSKLIGEFVNVVKREVEDSWNWQALRNTITANTVVDSYIYVLTGTDTRIRIIDVINDTTDSILHYMPSSWFNRQFLLSDIQREEPMYYNPNGISDDGEVQIDLYPIPDAVYAIRFNLFQPEPELVEDGDTLRTPWQIIIEGAVARAISERGDDGGYTEQEQRYNRIMSDYIANEAGMRPDETTWYPA